MGLHLHCQYMDPLAWTPISNVAIDLMQKLEKVKKAFFFGTRNKPRTCIITESSEGIELIGLFLGNNEYQRR